jgi:hypothetical protein
VENSTEINGKSGCWKIRIKKLWFFKNRYNKILFRNNEKIKINKTTTQVKTVIGAQVLANIYRKYEEKKKKRTTENKQVFLLSNGNFSDKSNLSWW